MRSRDANPTYTVTYNGNDGHGGSVPIDTTNYEQSQTVTVLGNTGDLAETGYTFAVWNTQYNGTGTTYTPGQTFMMGTSDITLYALWSFSAPPPACVYTYSAWGACQPNGTQIRTVLTTTPSICTGTPTTSQSCVYGAPVTLATISVTPANSSIINNGTGTSLQFTATGVYTDSTTQNLTTEATWTTTNSNVAFFLNGLPNNLDAGIAFLVNFPTIGTGEITIWQIYSDTVLLNADSKLIFL